MTAAPVVLTPCPYCGKSDQDGDGEDVPGEAAAIRAWNERAIASGSVVCRVADDAFPLKIIRRPLLNSGVLATVPDGIAILIDDRADEIDANVSLWHETVHMLLMAGGLKNHDEEMVEGMAQRLAAACPEMLSMCMRDAAK